MTSSPRQMLLLVDSDIRSMRMLEVSLRKAGYDVEMARDGEEAIAAVERRVPDLILSDTRLQTPPTVTSPLVPRDGYDFCERLKSNEAWARVPFMFLTGSVDLNDKIRGLQLGVEDYLTKPIYLKELLTRVQLVLARKRRESITATTRASFAGELGGMGLIDLLTTVDLGRKTGLIEIDAGAEQGSLIFRDGQVVDAATGKLRGERAVYRMLRWNDGSFTARFGASTLDGVAVTRTISTGIQGLMLEGLRRADEWNHLESSFAPLDASWEVDREALAQAGDALDPLAVSLAERVDGRATLGSLLEACNDDLAALEAAASLRDKGILRRVGAPPSPPSPPQPVATGGEFEALDRMFSEPDSAPVATHAAEAPPPVVSEAPAPVSPPAAGTEGAGKSATLQSKTSGRLEGGPLPRTRSQEHHVAKQKGKRQKGKHDTAPQPRSAPPAAAPAAPPRESAVAQSGGSVAARAEAPPESGLRVEGNVIHLPVPSPDASAQTNDASGAHPTPRDEKPADADVSALREAQGERERTTVPPAEGAAKPAEEAAKAEAPKPAEGEAKPEERSFFEPKPGEAAAKAPEAEAAKAEDPKAEPAKRAEEAMVEAQAAAALKDDDKKVDAKKADDKKADAKKDDKKADAKKADDKKADAKKGDTAAPRKDALSRDRKESLSSHLSEEAQAFFSEQAYQAAYKTTHDTFEDLVPAAEEHARESARSRQWMKISGAVVAAIVAVSVGFAAWHSRYAVRETTLLASRPTQPVVAPESQLPQPDPQPAANPPTPPTPPAPVANGPTEPAPAANPTEPAPAANPTEPAPTANGPTTAVTTTTPGTPPSENPNTAPVPTPAPTPAPSAQTPQQLLAAARGFRGAMPGRVAAYEAYFDAAPTDFRTMTTFAMSLAEMGRNADAERIANRAVTANPNNAQGWFILAVSRRALRNTAGAAEARTRCIALGGQWAAECRATQ